MRKGDHGTASQRLEEPRLLRRGGDRPQDHGCERTGEKRDRR